MKECTKKGCLTCEKLIRLKRHHGGYIFDMTRGSEGTIGESVHASINLEEYGFVVIKICDMANYYSFELESKSITCAKDGAIK